MSGPTKAQYLAAARLIEKRGWYRLKPSTAEYAVGNENGRCMVDGLRIAGDWKAEYGLYAAFIEFNDAPGRTKAEVLSALLGLAEVAP